MVEPVLTVLVVTHNSERWLPGFFESWQRAAGEIAAEIVVADSGSTDRSREVAVELEPRTKILPCENIGYGAAANRGVANSVAPWILLCNPDLEFERDICSSFIIPAMREASARAGCIAPGLLNDDDTGQPSIGNFPTIGGLIRDVFRERALRKYMLRPREMRPYMWATGACLLIRREHWNRVGGFDEKFFLHVEEVDFQRRLADCGLRTWFRPQPVVNHLGPTASKPPDARIRRYAARGMLRYFAKHGSEGQLFWYRLMAVLTFRLSRREAFASRKEILDRPTGP